MRKTVIMQLLLTATMFLALQVLAGSAKKVQVTQSKGDITVSNSHYSVTFSASSNYAITAWKINGFENKHVNTYFELTTDGENEVFKNGYSPAPMGRRNSSDVKAEVVSSNDETATVRLNWAFAGGKIVETVKFDQTPAIKWNFKVDYSVRLNSIFFRSSNPNFIQKDSLFYPDGEIKFGLPGWGHVVKGATWRYAWNRRKSAGLGIVLPAQDKLAGITYQMDGRMNGLHDKVFMEAVWNPLVFLGKKGTFSCDVVMICGGDPESAEKIARDILPPAPAVEIADLEIERLVTRPGVENNYSFKLVNNSGKKVKLQVIPTLYYGVEKSAAQKAISCELNPGEEKIIKNRMELPEDLRWGATLKVVAEDESGKNVAEATEFCAVSNSIHAVAGFGIINVGQARQEGTEKEWNKFFRRSYIGSYEYYCWAASTIGGLAPKADVWDPHTESQGSYRVALSKKFLKTLIDDAHSRGMGVFALITGLCNYEYAYGRPELLQYDESGQPLVYNGGIHGKKRFSVWKPNIYTTRAAAEWGDEMADSVDMFGWDGCRWDWNFNPMASNDPLFGDSRVGEWYDWKGVPSSKLFPNPDKTAAEAITAWRKAVNKRHPNFINGSNYNANAITSGKYPLHTKALTTDSLILFESLLNYTRPNRDTFASWGKVLSDTAEAIRCNRAYMVVGSMVERSDSSIGEHLAHYVSISAGVKWWESIRFTPSSRKAERNSYMMRFSEYYFDPDFLRGDLKVALTGKDADKLLYADFVRERKVNGRHEIAVPVVNLPAANAHIAQYYDAPAVRKNITLAVNGREIAEAFAMTPQNPVQAEKLEVSGNSVKLPEIYDAALILVRLK